MVTCNETLIRENTEASKFQGIRALKLKAPVRIFPLIKTQAEMNVLYFMT